jgi:FAD/FMN-containing dehydrogenase
VRSEDLVELTRNLPLTRGLGRAYGDAALPAPSDFHVAGTTFADRIIGFDESSGVLKVEAGFSLDELCRIFLRRGYFTPVSPGTRFVTIGGMVACDVHGKNHHREGTFGQHVLELLVRVGDGRVVRCSLDEHRDLFRATVGGMGLTGSILEVTFRLTRIPSAWIYEERERIADIGQFLQALELAAGSWPMTVGWIDCLARGRHMGRGIVFRGRWAEPHECPDSLPEPPRRLSVPLELPPYFLSAPTVRAFNRLNYWRHIHQRSSSIVNAYGFFYPLDAIGNWTRLYGHRGFTQYQCVLPKSGGAAAARRFLEYVSSHASASFLAVIKDCGSEGLGVLSFPKPGISIALDIPMRNDTQSLIDSLNELVIAEGGRIYLAKDVFTRAEHFRAMDPRVNEFLEIRRRWDPQGRIRSAQSMRLFGW